MTRSRFGVCIFPQLKYLQKKLNRSDFYDLLQIIFNRTINTLPELDKKKKNKIFHQIKRQSMQSKIG